MLYQWRYFYWNIEKYLNHEVILAQNSNVLKVKTTNFFLFSDKMKVEQDYDVKDFIRNGETRKVCLSF